MVKKKKAKAPKVEALPIEKLKCDRCGATYKSDSPKVVVTRDCIECGEYDCVGTIG